MFAYGAMFMGKPHADLTPSAMRRSVNAKQLLDERHEPEFYFLAAVAVMRARQALRTRRLLGLGRERPSWGEYGAKNQLLYALRLLMDKKAGATLPKERWGPTAMRYLEGIRKVVLDQRSLQKLAGLAVGVLDEAEVGAKEGGRPLQGPLYERARREAFTSRVELLCARRRV
jgi:hypothetical protein